MTAVTALPALQPSFGDSSSETAAPSATFAKSTFAFALYDQLSRENGNVFFSPFSLERGFALAYAGARGDTADELQRVFDFKTEKSEVTGARAGSIEPKASEGLQLRVANALWGQKGYSFVPAFATTLRRDFEAPFGIVDFERQPRLASRRINLWAKQSTAGKIPKVVSPELFKPSPKLLLTNAVYFNGLWQDEFWPGQTRPRPFKISETETVSAPMMINESSFNYAETDLCQVLEMPYKGYEYSMVVLLPVDPQKFSSLEKSLAANLNDAWSRFKPRLVDVLYPRFQISSDLRLEHQMKEMGLRLSFSPNADFSGITRDKQNIQLSAVVHKTFVKVTEKGTEAAAATLITGIPGGAGAGERLRFTADHPFVFLIVNRSTRDILFIGRLSDPR